MLIVLCPKYSLIWNPLISSVHIYIQFNSAFFLYIFLSAIQCSHYSCPGTLDFDRQPRHASLGRKLEKVSIF